MKNVSIPEPSSKGLSFRTSVFLLLVSAVLVTLFSTCSPLYPINPWDDAHVFMTIGKSMLKGKVLYVEIFDQKGPMLFLLHELAAAISYTSFFGIYILEILCLWFFLWFGLKSMRLFSSSTLNVPLMCLVALLTVSSDAFYYGDSAEEFCLPLMAHALFLMLRFVTRQEIPSRRESFFMGIGAGLIFWIKFNIIVFFYGGSLLALLYVAYRYDMLRQLLKPALWILLGIMIPTLLVFAYFIVHHATDALIDAYFYTNLFKYSGVSSNGEPDVWWFIFVKLAIMCVMLLPVYLAKTGTEVKLLVLSSYGALLLSFTFFTVQFYYFLLLFVYAPLIIILFRHIKSRIRSYGLMLCVATVAFALNWNFVSLVRGSFSHLTLDITEIVNRNETEDSEVMNFASYDTGIFLKTRHLPLCRYFFINNIEDEAIREEQRALANSGRVRYLAREVVPSFAKTSHDFYDIPIPDNYKLVYQGEEKFRYRFYTRPYRYLWNLEYLRPLLRHIVAPETEPRRMLLYERDARCEL